MSNTELILTALGLSMDAFAVSLCMAADRNGRLWSGGYTAAFIFGAFQGLMTVLGYCSGSYFTVYISAFDHWISFTILSFIGGKMIYSAFFGEEEYRNRDLFDLLILSVATSMDALAVGVGYSFVNADIVFAASVIGLVTFILCLFAVFMSHRFGAYSGYKAELLGGIIIIIVALKLLFSHLGIICL